VLHKTASTKPHSKRSSLYHCLLIYTRDGNFYSFKSTKLSKARAKINCAILGVQNIEKNVYYIFLWSFLAL